MNLNKNSDICRPIQGSLVSELLCHGDLTMIRLVIPALVTSYID